MWVCQHEFENCIPVKLSRRSHDRYVVVSLVPFAYRYEFPKGSKHVSIYSPSGSLQCFFNLTPEQSWLLADMLMEGIEDEREVTNAPTL